jgi:hypothetical protein
MQTSPLTFLLLAGSVVPPLSADVTVRSRIEIKFGAVIPGPVAERTRNGTQSDLPDSTVSYRKGGQEYLQSGKFACRMDFAKQEITIIDAEHKRFATVAMKEYAGRLAAAMPAVRPEFRMAEESAKTILSSRKTGRTDVMQGVAVEETEYTVTLDLPVPVAAGQTQAGPLLKVTMQVWMAKPAEVSRVEALRELTSHIVSAPGFSRWIDPSNILATIFGAMPGLGDGMSRMFQEIEKSKSAVFKSHLEASMPGMASFLQQMQREQGNPLPNGLDPNAPFAVVDSQVVELSTTPVDDAVFQLPADYHSAPFEDVVKSIAPDFPKS